MKEVTILSISDMIITRADAYNFRRKAVQAKV